MGPNGKTPPYEVPKTLKQINERHRRFWVEQSVLRDRRISDTLLFDFATKTMHRKSGFGLHPGQQISIEKALEDAETTRDTFQSAFSRKGGIAHKDDALQDLIQEIVPEVPNITAGQLERVLRGSRGAGVVVSIDEESDVRADESRIIYFLSDNGTPKMAPVSGLKDRLFRAKKK